MKGKWDSKARDHRFKEGDLVYIAILPKPKIGYGKGKSRYQGPFELGRQTSSHNFEVFSLLGEYKGIMNVNQMKYYRENDRAYDIGRAQELEEEDPIYKIDLNDARRVKPEITGGVSDENIQEVTDDEEYK